jgi:hypothetical protein
MNSIRNGTTGNPAIFWIELDLTKTGGFASPSLDGFA